VCLPQARPTVTTPHGPLPSTTNKALKSIKTALLKQTADAVKSCCQIAANHKQQRSSARGGAEAAVAAAAAVEDAPQPAADVAEESGSGADDEDSQPAAIPRHQTHSKTGAADADFGPFWVAWREHDALQPAQHSSNDDPSATTPTPACALDAAALSTYTQQTIAAQHATLLPCSATLEAAATSLPRVLKRMQPAACSSRGGQQGSQPGLMDELDLLCSMHDAGAPPATPLPPPPPAAAANGDDEPQAASTPVAAPCMQVPCSHASTPRAMQTHAATPCAPMHQQHMLQQLLAEALSACKVAGGGSGSGSGGRCGEDETMLLLMLPMLEEEQESTEARINTHDVALPSYLANSSTLLGARPRWAAAADEQHMQRSAGGVHAGVPPSTPAAAAAEGCSDQPPTGGCSTQQPASATAAVQLSRSAEEAEAAMDNLRGLCLGDDGVEGGLMDLVVEGDDLAAPAEDQQTAAGAAPDAVAAAAAGRPNAALADQGGVCDGSDHQAADCSVYDLLAATGRCHIPLPKLAVDELANQHQPAAADEQAAAGGADQVAQQAKQSAFVTQAPPVSGAAAAAAAAETVTAAGAKEAAEAAEGGVDMFEAEQDCIIASTPPVPPASDGPPPVASPPQTEAAAAPSAAAAQPPSGRQQPAAAVSRPHQPLLARRANRYRALAEAAAAAEAASAASKAADGTGDTTTTTTAQEAADCIDPENEPQALTAGTSQRPADSGLPPRPAVFGGGRLKGAVVPQLGRRRQAPAAVGGLSLHRSITPGPATNPCGGGGCASGGGGGGGTAAAGNGEGRQAYQDDDEISSSDAEDQPEGGDGGAAAMVGVVPELGRRRPPALRWVGEVGARGSAQSAGVSRACDNLSALQTSFHSLPTNNTGVCFATRSLHRHRHPRRECRVTAVEPPMDKHRRLLRLPLQLLLARIGTIRGQTRYPQPAAAAAAMRMTTTISRPTPNAAQQPAPASHPAIQPIGGRKLRAPTQITAQRLCSCCPTFRPALLAGCSTEPP